LLIQIAAARGQIIEKHIIPHTASDGLSGGDVEREMHSAIAYDTATADAALYTGGGNAITNLLINSGYQIAHANLVGIQNAVTAVVGRYSGYTARFTFQRDGSLQPAGTPRKRKFKTEEYDFYVQDIWKLSRNLTLTRIKVLQVPDKKQFAKHDAANLYEVLEEEKLAEDLLS
jgi:hypothetical protein